MDTDKPDADRGHTRSTDVGSNGHRVKWRARVPSEEAGLFCSGHMPNMWIFMRNLLVVVFNMVINFFKLEILWGKQTMPVSSIPVTFYQFSNSDAGWNPAVIEAW